MRPRTAFRRAPLLLEQPADLLQQRGYKNRMLDLRRNRYFLHDAIEETKAIKGRRRRKPKWKLETSEDVSGRHVLVRHHAPPAPRLRAPRET